MKSELEDAKARLIEEESALTRQEEELKRAEKSLSEMEAAAEAAKGEIIRIMNRLSDVRSQQARLSAMKAALEQQISGMDQTSLRDQEGLDALSQHAREAQDQAGRGKAAADGIEGAHGIHGEIRAGGRRGRQAPGNRIYPGPG